MQEEVDKELDAICKDLPNFEEAFDKMGESSDEDDENELN